jgi:hypothetical protein
MEERMTNELGVKQVQPIRDKNIRGAISRTINAVKKVNREYPVLVTMDLATYDFFLGETADAIGQPKEGLKLTSVFNIPLQVKENAPLGTISVLTQHDGAWTHVNVPPLPVIVVPKSNIFAFMRRG